MPLEPERSTFAMVSGAVAADLQALVGLLQEDLSDLRLPVAPPDLQRAAERLIAADAAHVWLRVARLDTGGPPVGVLVAHRWVSTKFAGDALWIETLYVSPAARRLGLGRLLTESVIREAREAGIRGIDLEAYRMNAPASYLYRALGFRRLNRERYSLPL